MRLHNLSCCGIKEIIGLSHFPGSSDLFLHMIREYSGLLPCAWVCFNGVRSSGYVAAFATFLEENKLGQVITLPEATNPNSSNVLDVRMWLIDRPALQAWYTAQATRPCGCGTCVGNRRAEARDAAYRQQTYRVLVPPPAPAPSTMNTSNNPFLTE